MNELAARTYATQLAERWPGCILTRVDVPPKREDEQGYVVRLTILRRNRVLRLTRERQLPGILDICEELLDLNEGQPIAPALTIDETEEENPMPTEQAEQQETETITAPVVPANVILSEEESATYLGVKQHTIRTYNSTGALQKQENGGYLLEDLRKYKEERDTRWGRAKKPTPGTDASAKSDPPGEAQLLQALIAHVFTQTVGITGLGRLSEAPRSWKVDVTTERGPESYRVMRNIDGSFQQERW